MNGFLQDYREELRKKTVNLQKSHDNSGASQSSGIPLESKMTRLATLSKLARSSSSNNTPTKTHSENPPEESVPPFEPLNPGLNGSNSPHQSQPQSSIEHTIFSDKTSPISKLDSRFVPAGKLLKNEQPRKKSTYDSSSSSESGTSRTRMVNNNFNRRYPTSSKSINVVASEEVRGGARRKQFHSNNPKNLGSIRSSDTSSYETSYRHLQSPLGSDYGRVDGTSCNVKQSDSPYNREVGGNNLLQELYVPKLLAKVVAAKRAAKSGPTSCGSSLSDSENSRCLSSSPQRSDPDSNPCSPILSSVTSDFENKGSSSSLFSPKSEPRTSTANPNSGQTPTTSISLRDRLIR